MRRPMASAWRQTPLVIAVLTAGTVPARGGDLAPQPHHSAQAPAPAEARFTLRGDRFDYEPRSRDGSLVLHAIVQPLPPEPVAESRFALSARLRAKAVSGGDCASGVDDVFADGFE